MNESEAKAALRAQGIRNPSQQLVEDYMRVQQTEEWALEVPSLRSVDGIESAEAKPEPKPHPSSESNLEQLLREHGRATARASTQTGQTACASALDGGSRQRDVGRNDPATSSKPLRDIRTHS